MWLSEQKAAIFVHKVNLHLCEKITMPAHCLHWLISTGLLFQSAFDNHLNSHPEKWY